MWKRLENILTSTFTYKILLNRKEVDNIDRFLWKVSMYLLSLLTNVIVSEEMKIYSRLYVEGLNIVGLYLNCLLI